MKEALISPATHTHISLFGCCLAYRLLTRGVQGCVRIQLDVFTTVFSQPPFSLNHESLRCRSRIMSDIPVVRVTRAQKTLSVPATAQPRSTRKSRLPVRSPASGTQTSSNSVGTAGSSITDTQSRRSSYRKISEIGGNIPAGNRARSKMRTLDEPASSIPASSVPATPNEAGRRDDSANATGIETAAPASPRTRRDDKQSLPRAPKEQMKPFSLTIRISRIPAAWGKEQLCERLKSLYEEGPHGSDAAVGAARNPVKIRSLAKDPRDPDYKMATAEINPLPGQLNALKTATSHSLAIGDEHELHFDTGFIGLTTLHTPESPVVE